MSNEKPNQYLIYGQSAQSFTAKVSLNILNKKINKVNVE
jgi:hypothetical protein